MNGSDEGVLLQALGTIEPRTYLLGPIPSRLDEEIGALLDRYQTGDVLHDEDVLVAVSKKHPWHLLAFSSRMAALAVREESPDHVLKGLLALALADDSIDLREKLQILALHYNSSVRIGVNAFDLFRSAASRARGSLADEMRRFPERSPEDRSLEAMGFREAQASDGFTYQRTW